MESTPSPHEKLTEEQLKKVTCELQMMVNECSKRIEQIKEITSDLQMMVNQCNERIKNTKTFLQQSQYLIYKLKKHFCPEKFSQIKIPIEELQNYLEEKGEKNDVTT